MRRVIIDTDPGVDDALAILMVMGMPDVRIEAITTVAGNVSVNAATRNARAIALWANYKVPIIAGAGRPLYKTLELATIHGEDGLSGLAPQSVVIDDTDRAVDRLLQLITRYPGEIEILAIGPLTNIAHAIRADPVAMRHIKSLTILGGAIAVRGNTNDVAEFNFYTDPDAADIVLSSGLPIVLIPLDRCYETLVSVDVFSELPPQLKTFCDKLLSPYLIRQKENEGTLGLVIYDALAACVLANAESGTYMSVPLRVDATGGNRRGALLANFSSPINVRVVRAVDCGQFASTLQTTLKRLTDFDDTVTQKT